MDTCLTFNSTVLLRDEILIRMQLARLLAAPARIPAREEDKRERRESVLEYMLTWKLQKPSGIFPTATLSCFCSASPLFLILLCVLSLHLLRSASASLYVNVALNPTVWRNNVFSLCGLSLLGDFYSSPPMNIILNHMATESFAALLKSRLLKKAICYPALHNLEQKLPCG